MAEPIRFYKGEEDRIIKEHYSNINASMFKEQYYSALNMIGNFLSSDSDESNNIFAFLGDRGTGKTSCMESVALILNDLYQDNLDKNNRKNDFNISAERWEALTKNSYYILDIIDPTKFDDNSNILEVVIGMLFKNFKDKIRCKCNKPCDEKENKYEIDKQRLLDSFQRVKDCLKFINNPKLFDDEDDDISRLDDLASVSKLKDLIGDLTKNFLLFFNKDILVLKIDDIDLQTIHAYPMVEQIRKYFIHSNVVILMAAKLEQLNKVVELENTKKYNALLVTNRIDSSEIMNIATKYLTKLIPVNHRIVLPVFEDYAEKGIDYYDGEGHVIHWPSVKYSMTKLIFQKTRFLFYHTKGEISPIVPRNLREFRHLFAMLVEMSVYDKKHPNISNKSRFLDYFNGIWVNNNIDAKDYDIVEDIRNVKDASRINKVVLQQLKNKFGSTLLTNFDEGQEQIPEILNVKNVQYNISIADVMVVLEYIKQRTVSISDKMLLFYIESFYSIKLYQYYDVITERYQDWWTERKDEYGFNKAVDSTIRKRDIVDEYSDYEVLSGGRFINTDYYTLVPSGTDKNPRDHRKVLFDVLKAMANELVNGSPRLAALPQEEAVKQLQLVEFFALCTSRVLDSRENINKQYRIYDNLSYKYEFDNQNKYVLFDLGSFFFNIVNIKKAYNRIHPQLFREAETTGGSLYKQLLEVCGEERGWDNQPYAILSCACIRNYEILTDFVKTVLYSWEKRSPNVSNTENLITFFNRVGRYKINIYNVREREFDEELFKRNTENLFYISTDYEEMVENEIIRQAEDVPYKISFAYAKVISDVLKNIGEDLFNTVFAPITEDVKKSPEQKKNVLQVFDIDAIMTYLPKRDLFSLNVFLRRVRECCDPIFRNNRELTQKWYHLPIFEVERARKKISRDNARVILIKFKNDNNL